VRFNLSRCGERIGSLTRGNQLKVALFVSTSSTNKAIGKPVLIPTRMTPIAIGARKDKLKIKKMKKAQDQNQNSKNLSGLSHRSHNLSHHMHMCCCMCCC